MRNYKLYTDQVTPSIIDRRDDLFRAIFNDSPDAIFFLQPVNFTILDCNAKAIQLFQAEEKKELIERDTFSLYESEPVEFSRNTFMENINNGMVHSQEMAFKSLKGNVFWGRCSIRKVDTKGGALVIFRVRRVVDYMKTTEMLSSMIKKTSKTTGYAFFTTLTELLSKSFGVSTVLVARVSEDGKTATTIHGWHKTQPLENVTFDLETSVAFNVLHGYPTFYPRNLREMFPDDILIPKINAEGFMGTPVYGSTENVSGLLILMDDKPMEEIPNSRYVLSILASRAGAELERMLVEENYQKKIQELKDRIGHQQQ